MKKIIAGINKFYAKCWQKIREKIAGRMIRNMLKSGQFNVVSLDPDSDDLDPMDLKLMVEDRKILIIE